ncbi:MAG: CsgG/HfaB family protein [Caulobacter sp.]|nr:CsgG/HfaB family protein [Caulobacter sp.]
MLKVVPVALAIVAALAFSPAWAQPAGLKKTVAVESFGGSEVFGGQVASDGPPALLTEILMTDGRFVVVERAALSALQSEQQLGSGGSATSETAAGSGRMIGASYLIRGAVTAYNPTAGGGGLRLGGVPGGSALGLGAGVQSRKATVKISLRLIDATTGQVVATSSAEGIGTSRDMDAGVVDLSNGATLGLNTLKSTSMGKALEDAIRKALAALVIDPKRAPWTGLVVDVRGETIILNAGADQNVGEGMVFGVYRKGETLTDPGTGEVLDVDIQRLGSVRVESVRDKVSIARMVEGQSPSRGDLLKSE